MSADFQDRCALVGLVVFSIALIVAIVLVTKIELDRGIIMSIFVGVVLITGAAMAICDAVNK